MSLIENRAAVGALHRHISLRTDSKILPCVDEAVRLLRPEEPLYCVRPDMIRATAGVFKAAFKGTVLYAVKCNPEPAVLRALWDGGIRHFDCASISEVQLVRRLFPGAEIHFMHPVKSRSAIRESWLRYEVSDFVLDSKGELAKIMEELGRPEMARTDAKPGLFVRLGLPETGASINLSKKFGAAVEEAVELLRMARPMARKLGVAFHVGSQCLDPLAWRDAIRLAGEVIRAAGVRVDVLDIGGGFPIAYPDMNPPPLSAFMAEIDAAYEALQMPWLKLWAEPGRALVGGGSSVVVQVQMRRGNMLYINDGVYGALADAGALHYRFPTRLLRAGREQGAPDMAFGFFGPSCDSLDVMNGPFMLPDDVAEGDWIEVGQLGAYGTCLRTAFNGFDRAALVEVSDRAMMETAGYELSEA